MSDSAPPTLPPAGTGGPKLASPAVARAIGAAVATRGGLSRQPSAPVGMSKPKAPPPLSGDFDILDELDNFDAIFNDDKPPATITKAKSVVGAAALGGARTRGASESPPQATRKEPLPVAAPAKKATPAAGKPNLPPAPPGVIEVARVLEDYDAVEDTELSLLEGQRLWVYKVADDWHLGAVISTPDKKGW
jgi:hypothetical protein